MQTKEIKGRVVLKHDTAANWKTAGDKGFCPLANEIIMFDPDDSCAMIRYKIGRWANEDKTALVNINDLPFESNVYVGHDEPVNAPAGFIWVDTSDEIKTITFTITQEADASYRDDLFVKYNSTSITYQAKEGMTWRDWIQSEYNIDHWQCNIDCDEFVDDGADHIFGVISEQRGYMLVLYHTSSWNEEDFIDCDSLIEPNHSYMAWYTP